jgi:ABC-2 type transport system permease protein
LFFFGLSMLVVLSSILTSYSSFFRSREIPYLLRQPVGLTDLLFYKYLESTLFSSWAFCFIIVPFIGAYAAHQDLSPWFMIWTLLFSVPFVMLGAGLGSLVTIIGIRWLPRGRALVLLVGGVLLLSGWGFARAFVSGLRPDQEATLVLTQLIPGLKTASHPLWPSWWVAEGIMAMSRAHYGRGLLFLGVLIANTLLMIMLLDVAGRAWFFDGWQRVIQASSRKRRRGRLLTSLSRILHPLPADIRAIIIKDIRTFFREPAQWSQGVFFFGLLGLYFLNLRNLHYDRLPMEWRNIIAYLNVFSVSAVMASLGCRFVYPQLSLEGHSFWVLGLAPTSMGRVLAAKFLLAWCTMEAVSLGLMGLCVHMLQVPMTVGAVSLLMAFAVSSAVAGLSVGLGAVFIDLRRQNPSAIVSSFGGTLDLVLSLGYILMTMFPFVLISRLNQHGHLSGEGLAKGLLLASSWLIVMTATATWLPLWFGHRTLLRKEY